MELVTKAQDMIELSQDAVHMAINLLKQYQDKETIERVIQFLEIEFELDSNLAYDLLDQFLVENI